MQFYFEPFSRSENIESISVRIEVPSFIESKDWDKAIVILLTWQKRRHVGYPMDFGVDSSSSSFIGPMACGVRGNWEKYIKSFSRGWQEEMKRSPRLPIFVMCIHGDIASKRIHRN